MGDAGRRCRPGTTTGRAPLDHDAHREATLLCRANGTIATDRTVVTRVTPVSGVAVDVILPTLDEALALPALLAAMPDGYRPIVVDNGSTDGSAEIARAAGAVVVAESQKGFGAACWSGLNAATADVVAFMDADGSLDPRDLPSVCGPVLSGESDLVLGARIVARGAMPPHARLANRYLGWKVSRMTGAPMSDLGPMRAMRREPLLELGMQDR